MQSVDTVMFNLMFNLLPRQKHLMFPARPMQPAPDGGRAIRSTPGGEHAARQLGGGNWRPVGLAGSASSMSSTAAGPRGAVMAERPARVWCAPMVLGSELAFRMLV